jgi:hypothetical protein
MNNLPRIFVIRIQMLFFALLAFCVAMLIPMTSMAADFVIPEGDVTAILLNLATNYKTLGIVGILSALTMISVQAIKAFVPEQWQYKRLITLIVAIAYSVLSGILLPGSNVVSVIVTVFITSGGAVALYEGLKGAKIIKAS